MLRPMLCTPQVLVEVNFHDMPRLKVRVLRG